MSQITVNDGIATLAGHPENDQAGHSLAMAVRGGDGVVADQDQLSYTTGRPARRY